MNNVVPFPTIERGRRMVRQLSPCRGYGEYTTAALVRSFRVKASELLWSQVKAHVRPPHMSATSGDAA